VLLSHLLSIPLPADIDREITGLATDSRQLKAGHVFIALAGEKTHGAQFIDKALQQGAAAILKEHSAAEISLLAEKVPCVSIPNLSQQLGTIAAQFYQHPSQQMNVIGITGTNGKTSTSHFIAQLLHQYSPCGLIGTLGYGVYGKLQLGLFTTPDALTLQGVFAQLRAQHVAQVVMEVSSHGLAQARIQGTQFDTAVFTNLSRDHLDYHHSMEEYGAAKQLLFTHYHVRTAVINIDDAFGHNLLHHLPSSVKALRYSLHHPMVEIYAKILRHDAEGYHIKLYTPWGKGEVLIPLLGEFNISNVLAAVSVLLNHGIAFDELLNLLPTLRPVKGRMEKLGGGAQPTVVVDYAHTPDALQQTLHALRKHTQGKLWCVFGCGGDRDQGKRPLMGKIAEELAEHVILTNDNPRHENPQIILQGILAGIHNPAAVQVIPERQAAIEYALQHAHANDIVLIAGKGHEDYQQIGDQRLNFSDQAVVKTCLESLHHD